MARTKQTSRKSTGGKSAKTSPKKSSTKKSVSKKVSSPSSVEELNKLKVVELKEICKKMGIKCPTKKAEIISAIVNAKGRASKRSSESIEIKTTKKRSPSKKPSKKSVGEMKLSPPRYNYDTMKLVDLKKECKKRQLKDENRKCPPLKKKELIDLLKLWDGLDLPPQVEPEDDDELEISFEDDSYEEEKPKKVATKKRSPSKKPAKKTSKKVATKKPVKKTTTKVKKSLGEMKLSPPRYNYDTMKLVDLKKECKKRQLKDENRKCPPLKKKELIDLLKLWDGLDLPPQVDPEEDDDDSSVDVKVSPVKSKKRSPAKKSTKKRSPVKKVPTKKRSPAKKTRKARCDDKEDFLECEDGAVCSASSGKCVKDSKSARKGKVELHVDGRVILGSEKVIKDLQKVLGGEIVGEKKVASRKRVTPPKRPSRVRASPALTKKEKGEYKKRQEEIMKRGPGSSPVYDFDSDEEPEIATMEDISEDISEEEVKLEELLKKKKPSKGKRSPAKKKSPPKLSKKESEKVSKQKATIQKTFEECLESLGGDL